MQGHIPAYRAAFGGLYHNPNVSGSPQALKQSTSGPVAISLKTEAEQNPCKNKMHCVPLCGSLPRQGVSPAQLERACRLFKERVVQETGALLLLVCY